MKEYKVGVVGLGWVAGSHIDNLHRIPGVTVAGVFSRTKYTGKELEKKFGRSMKYYPTYEAMLADKKIDVVDICSPHHHHPTQSIQAAEAGKHVIIEKPVALNLEDLNRMRKVFRKTGVHTCVCFEGRHSRPGEAIASLLSQGYVGKIHYVESDYFHGIGPQYKQYGWNIKKECGGSSLLTAGCHMVSSLLSLMNCEVEEVTAYAAKSEATEYAVYEYPTTTVTIAKFKNGAIGKVASSIDCIQPYDSRVHIIGSEGSIYLASNDQGVFVTRFYSKKIKGLNKDSWSILGTSAHASGDVYSHTFLPLFQSFFKHLRQNKPMPLNDFESTYEIHRFCMAADRSAELGRPVKMSELK